MNSDHDLDTELETHIQLRAEELERTGLSAAAARAAAIRELGDRSGLYRSARRRERRIRLREAVHGVGADLLLAWRRAAAAPAATTLTLLTFALGIGLSTAGFAVVDNVLLRPLPYERSEELVGLLSVMESGGEFPRVSAASWREWKRENRTVQASALHESSEFTVVAAGAALRVPGELVTGAFFEVLELEPLLGRVFTEADTEAGARLAMVDERFWRDVLGAQRELPIGIEVGGVVWEVVGVVASGRGYPATARIWLGNEPSVSRDPRSHTWINYMAIARLAPGASVASARADLSAIARRILERHPEAIYAHGVGVEPLRKIVVGYADTHLLMLAGAVGFVLLIACANVAGLGFARSTARAAELGVRTALGASRGRLVRQLLTESVALSLAGGALGLLFAWACVRVAVVSAAEMVPRAAEVAVDGRILLFALGVAAATGITAGIAPALRASRVSLRSVIGGSRGEVRGGRHLPGAALVAVEVAVALTLLTGGGLLVRSFQALVSRELGFRADGIVTAGIELPASFADPQSRTPFWTALEERIGTIPGVEAVAVASAPPGRFANVGFIAVDGRADDEPGGAGYLVIGDDYFEVLGIPLLAGRTFNATDRAGTTRVALINHAMAERYWSGRDPIGGTVRATSMESNEGAPWLTIVGVVGDVRDLGHFSDIRPSMYVLHRQVPTRSRVMTALARLDGSAPLAPVVGRMRDIVRELDAGIAPEIATLDTILEGRLSAYRSIMVLLSAFGGLALLLASIGLYGLLSFAVAQRSREIGVRAALGARRSGLLRLMLGSALRIVLLGAVAGLILSAWLVRLIEAMLIDVTPWEPAAWVGSFAVLLGVATAAALIPAWRAARTDPLTVLRN